MPTPHLGIVVGLTAEARLASGLGGVVETGGGDAPGATAAATRLIQRGAGALLSFGLAGGLSPTLAAGARVIPAAVVDMGGQTWPVDLDLARRYGTATGTLLAADHVIATVEAKRAAWQATGADAADLESGAVARVAAQHGLPFAVLRAVCDPAGRDLPPAALTALDAQGRIQLFALIRALTGNPGQIPALIALGRDAALARRTLLALVRASRNIV